MVRYGGMSRTVVVDVLIKTSKLLDVYSNVFEVVCVVFQTYCSLFSLHLCITCDEGILRVSCWLEWCGSSFLRPLDAKRQSASRFRSLVPLRIYPKDCVLNASSFACRI